MEKEERYYQIYFANESHSVSGLSFPLIKVFPREQSGRKKRENHVYVFEVYDPLKEKVFESDFSLAFMRDTASLDFTDLAEPVLASEKYRFFSMLDNSEAYRRIVSRLGVEKAAKVLISVHDVVASREASPLPKWLNHVEQERSFSVDFMKSYSRFFAFHNADSILRGLKEEKLDSMTTALEVDFKIPALQSSLHLELDFDQSSIVPKRIAILIGENGVGKSQTLSNIALSLIDDKTYLRKAGGGRPFINKLLAIASPGETVNTFPQERKYPRIDYKRLLTSRARNAKRSQGFGEICVQLFRSSQEDAGIQGKSRWDLFLNFVGKFDNPFQICLKRSPGEKDSDWVSHSDFEGSEEYQPIMGLNMNQGDNQLVDLSRLNNNLQPMRYVDGRATPLSSGQVTLLKFAAIACLHIENGTLVLLDEPETHFHPNFVSLFVELLDGLLKETGSLAIVASHSPYLVREVPRSQVFIYKRSEYSDVHIVKPRLKTFGADIDAISHFVFDDSIVNRLGENLVKELAEIKNTQQFSEFIEQNRDELPLEMLMYIERRLGVEI